MSTARPSCLLVLSSAIEGVAAESFIQAFTLVHKSFIVQLASPGGRAIEFVQQDENSRRWLNDFRTKSFSQPVSFEAIDANRYSALLFPHSPGAVNDLVHSTELGSILNHFVEEKKPICAIGLGVSGLFSAKKANGSWSFQNYALTGASVYELAKTPYFGSLSVIPEDFIKDSGAKYSCSEPNEVYVVIDRHIVTAQNDSSTLGAVQNLILLCNQKQTKQGAGK